MNRRNFVQKFGLGSSAALLTASGYKTLEIASDSSAAASDELQKLKQGYAELDTRTKIAVRLALLATGLDILLII